MLDREGEETMARRSQLPVGVALGFLGLGFGIVVLTIAHFTLREDDFGPSSSGQFDFETEVDTPEASDPLIDEDLPPPPRTWAELLDRQKTSELSTDALRARREKRDYEHEIRQGESLRGLARLYLGSERDLPLLIAHNPWLNGRDRIAPGDRLVIPYSKR